MLFGMYFVHTQNYAQMGWGGMGWDERYEWKIFVKCVRLELTFPWKCSSKCNFGGVPSSVGKR